jgi:hypothetical protein
MRTASQLPGLLLVPFDDFRAASRRGIRVLTGVATRAALAEQVPALVEVDPQLIEPPTVGVTRFPCGLPLPELVLLGHVLLDCPVNLCVVHPGEGTPPGR